MSTRSYRRPPSLLSRLLVWSGSLLLGGTAIIAGLWFLGVVEIPFLKSRIAPPPPSGMPVPLSGLSLPAYTKITRDHIVRPGGEPAVIYLPAEAIVKNEFLVDPARILGRVLRADKAAGYAFRERDFLPEGTRPGLVGGIPPGKRALVVEADRVRGIHWLKLGDRLDLLTSDPGGPIPKLAPGVAMPSGFGKAKIRVLAHDATIVQPVLDRPAPVIKPNSPRDKPKPAPHVLEVTIAVEPAEAASISEALASGAHIFAVPRSGQPEESSTQSLVPNSDPSPVTTIEVMQGLQRKLLVFPARAEAKSPTPPTAYDVEETK